MLNYSPCVRRTFAVHSPNVRRAFAPGFGLGLGLGVEKGIYPGGCTPQLSTTGGVGAAELRDYQSRAISDLRLAIRNGYRSIVLVCPTGAGKTRIASAMAKSAIAKRNRVLFLAPRRELVYQTVEAFDAVDIESNVIMAGEKRSIFGDSSVASIPTLHARCVQSKRMRFPRAELVIVDEAHIGVGGSAQQVIDHYREQGAIVIGLTATPARTDGRGLGRLYEKLVMGPTVAELTSREFLSPARYYGGPRPDLSNVKERAGDYAKSALAEVCDDEELVGDVVENWLRIAGDRQTFVYAVSRAHSRHLRDQFLAAGIRAEHVDGQTPNDERAAIQSRLMSGETQVLCNVGVLIYGIDCPPVSCVVLACPTKSVPRYMQMVGRGLRIAPGKKDCIVIDHGHAVDKLGFVDEPMPWSLDDDEKVQDRKDRQKQESKELKNIECPECKGQFLAAPKCPYCGHDMAAQHREAIAARDADLEEINRDRTRKANREWSRDEKAQFYGELLGYAQRRGFKPGFAAHKYRERLGVWPNQYKDATPREPTQATLGWIKSRQIARAKAQEAA